MTKSSTYAHFIKYEVGPEKLEKMQNWMKHDVYILINSKKDWKWERANIARGGGCIGEIFVGADVEYDPIDENWKDNSGIENWSRYPS